MLFLDEDDLYCQTFAKVVGRVHGRQGDARGDVGPRNKSDCTSSGFPLLALLMLSLKHTNDKPMDSRDEGLVFGLLVGVVSNQPMRALKMALLNAQVGKLVHEVIARFVGGSCETLGNVLLVGMTFTPSESNGMPPLCKNGFLQHVPQITIRLESPRPLSSKIDSIRDGLGFVDKAAEIGTNVCRTILMGGKHAGR